jgi:hypothetical protein
MYLSATTRDAGEGVAEIFLLQWSQTKWNFRKQRRVISSPPSFTLLILMCESVLQIYMYFSTVWIPWIKNPWEILNPTVTLIVHHKNPKNPSNPKNRKNWRLEWNLILYRKRYKLQKEKTIAVEGLPGCIFRDFFRFFNKSLHIFK